MNPAAVVCSTCHFRHENCQCAKEREKYNQLSLQEKLDIKEREIDMLEHQLMLEKRKGSWFFGL